jgi:Ca2+-binding RTX toxin-like protein
LLAEVQRFSVHAKDGTSGLELTGFDGDKRLLDRSTIDDDSGAPAPLLITLATAAIGGLGGNDLIRGLGGNDPLCGGEAKYNLQGGDGADRLLGGNGNDSLSGGAGNVILNGGPLNDLCDGGTGTDSATAGTCETISSLP